MRLTSEIQIFETPVKDLVNKIENFVQSYNATSKPFSWTATADSILQKIERLCKCIVDLIYESSSVSLYSIDYILLLSPTRIIMAHEADVAKAVVLLIHAAAAEASEGLSAETAL